jgi:branched-chain amino acid transport system substrate-binding protein
MPTRFRFRPAYLARTLVRVVVGLVTLGLLLAALAACGRESVAERRAAVTADPKADVVVAAVWPWATRREFHFGEGLDLAVDEVNRAGGIGGRRLRLLRVDDLESVDEGRLVAQRLGDSASVVAVIGHLQSYVTVPASTIYGQAGLLHFAPVSTDPALTAQGLDRVFRGTFTQDAVGARMAEFAAARGLKRVGVYYVRNPYGRGLANAFEERAGAAGVTVAAREAYEPTDDVSGQPFAQTLGEWKALDLDAIFVAGEVPAAAALVAEARRQGITVPMLGGDAMHAETLLRVAGRAAEGMVVASMFHPDEPRAEVRRFTATFRQRYGREPDMFSAIGYDAVHVLAAAMRRAGSPDPDRVAQALRDSAGGWVGATGAFRFDPHGDALDKPVVQLEVRGGRFEFVAVSGSSGHATVAAAPARAAAPGAPR